MSEKVLVTGAHGFIGSYLARALGPRYEMLPFAGDFLQDDVGAFVARHRPAYLIHLAWVTGKGYDSSHKNILFVQKSLELFEAFYQAGGKRAVGVGTEQEYARQLQPVREDAPLRPSSLYACCKQSLGSMLLQDCKAQGRGFIWARLFFVYGEGEKPERLMPSLMDGLLERGEAVCSHHALVRDYLHVSDVAAALACCLFSEENGAVNVAGGMPTTIGEIASLIREAAGGGHIVHRTREACADQPEVIQADITRLRALGFTPRVPLREGLRQELAARRRVWEETR